MPTVTVEYFALFRERAGCMAERLARPDESVGELYRSLLPRLALDPSLVRAAVNGEFVENDHPLAEGDRVTFIPPVAGG